MLEVKVSPDTKLLNLHLARAAALRATHEGVIARMVEIGDVGHVEPELAGEVRTVEQRSALAAVPIQPREVGKGERRADRSRPGAGADRHGVGLRRFLRVERERTDKASG